MAKQEGFRLKLMLVLMVSVLMCVLALSVKAQTASYDEQGGGISSVYTDRILSKADITVDEDDKIIRSDGKGCIALTIVRAYEVEIDYRGQIFTVRCADGTVADAIKKAGITLSSAHTVTPAEDTPLSPGCKITITAACGVLVTADGKTDTYNVTAVTVGELLQDLGITVDEDDMVTPSLSDAVYDGVEVVIRRVEYREETTTEVIDYGYISEETTSLVSGTSKIKQYGIEGEKTVISRQKYVDGELAESVTVSEKVTREPVDQIKLIGTGKAPSYSNQGNSSVSNIAGKFTDSSGKTVSYTRKLTGISTAYYAAEGSMTATGTPVFVGGVAVNPNVIPYGTRLYIVTSDGSRVYGYATAVDTGGALMSGSVLVDVFFPTYNECVSWGRRNVTVYVLD